MFHFCRPKFTCQRARSGNNKAPNKYSYGLVLDLLLLRVPRSFLFFFVISRGPVRPLLALILPVLSLPRYNLSLASRSETARP
jgi:hypothetical protein